MLLIHQRIAAFSQLGVHLKNLLNDFETGKIDAVFDDEVMQSALSNNSWFTKDNIHLMLKSIAEMLDNSVLENILRDYPLLETKQQTKTIAVIMAGNIPLVGFQDFLHVLLSGHSFLGKLSHQDSFLLPALAKMLIAIEPEFKDLISFAEQKINNFDAVIATGSDNSGRYFDYYFGKFPNLIRRNRHGVGILTGDESMASLQNLGLDIFSFFGLGCRNVSTLFVPPNFNFEPLFKAFEGFSAVAEHSKYFNNYEYNKAIFLVNGVKHLDNGFVLIRQAEDFGSPVAVMHYQVYDELKKLKEVLDLNQSKIQCIVSDNSWFAGSYPFGRAQFPGLTAYADGMDTIQFLLGLTSEI
jgi:hypothetical protein